MKKNLLLLWLVFPWWTFSQSEQADYALPLDFPPLLSATFGELRPGHFHSGIDMKTRGQTGYKVRAIADGYIYRIKVQKGGYGKTVYIRHPDGNISVYAHLDKFAGPVQDYVKRQQYRKERFFIELFPEEHILPVTKGQVIGYSGNTGSSAGPHLHFEIRQGENYPVNPMLYGFRTEDTLPPTVRKVFAYALDDTSAVNMTQKRVPLILNRKNSHYYITDPIEAYGEIGLGVDAYDQANKTWNKNGVYQTEMWVNGLKVYETRMDKISFSTTRNINVFIDYPYYVHHRRYVQRLWRHPEAKLPVYKVLVNKGKIKVEPGKTYSVVIKISDYEGNTTEIFVPVRGKRFDTIHPKNELTSPYFIRYKKPFEIKGVKTDIYFSANALYEDTYIQFTEFTNGFEILPADIPYRKSVTVRYGMEKIPGNKKKYAYLARVHPRNKKAYFASALKKQDSLILKTRTPGTYFVKYDSIPPVIDQINIPNGKWISNYRYLRFRVGDNVGVQSVEAYIDNKWILVEWDYKTGKAFYDFNDLSFDGSRHELKIIVTDKLGNRTEKNLIFYRKFKP